MIFYTSKNLEKRKYDEFDKFVAFFRESSRNFSLHTRHVQVSGMLAPLVERTPGTVESRAAFFLRSQGGSENTHLLRPWLLAASHPLG